MATAGEYAHRSAKAIRVYETAHGDPIGRPCFHCGGPIQHRWRDSLSDPEKYPYRDAFTVHHLDHDSQNDEPSNLSPSHHKCNSADLSPEGRERNRRAVSAALSGRRHSDETREKKRRCWTPEKRARHAEIMRGLHRRGVLAVRFRCNGCGLTTRAGALASHQAHTGHRGRTRVR
jgi:hypothetical protein